MTQSYIGCYYINDEKLKFKSKVTQRYRITYTHGHPIACLCTAISSLMNQITCSEFTALSSNILLFLSFHSFHAIQISSSATFLLGALGIWELTEGLQPLVFYQDTISQQLTISTYGPKFPVNTMQSKVSCFSCLITKNPSTVHVSLFNPEIIFVIGISPT